MGLVLSLGVTGCYGTLKDYSPKNQVEAEVRRSLLGFQQAYNARDPSMLVHYLHQEPVVVAESEGFFTVGERTGDEAVRFLSQAMDRFPEMHLGEPTIFIALEPGDRVVLEVISAFGKEAVPTKFSMIKDGERWAIKKILFY